MIFGPMRCRSTNAQVSTHTPKVEHKRKKARDVILSHTPHNQINRILVKFSFVFLALSTVQMHVESTKKKKITPGVKSNLYVRRNLHFTIFFSESVVKIWNLCYVFPERVVHRRLLCKDGKILRTKRRHEQRI